MRQMALLLVTMALMGLGWRAWSQDAPPAADQISAPHPHQKLGDGPGTENWPLQLRLPPVVEERLKQNERMWKRYQNRLEGGDMSTLVWTPPQAKRIRAVLLIPSLADSIAFGAYPALHEVATRHEMGVVYMRDAGSPDNVQDILNFVAARTGIREYVHAPWIVWGMSAAGRFPIDMTWKYPERTIASISWHGEVPCWSPVTPYPPEWARFGQTHLHVNFNGQNEWGQTWYRHVRPGLLNYRRQKGWLAHQVVAYGIGHGDYKTAGKTAEGVEPVSMARGFDYLAVFVDKALSLRLPEKGYPTDGPLQLRQVDEARGWLIHPRAVEELLGEPWRPLRFDEKSDAYIMDPEGRSGGEVQRGTLTTPLALPAGKVPAAERKEWMWVADREQAEAWFRLHAIHGQRFPEENADSSVGRDGPQWPSAARNWPHWSGPASDRSGAVER